jgi:hypothetical protein
MPRSTEVKSEYVDLMLRITGDTEIGERRPGDAAIHARLSQPGARAISRRPFLKYGRRVTPSIRWEK